MKHLIRVRRVNLGAAYFYHLTQQKVEDAIVPLLSKCLDNKWRVVVRGVDQRQLEKLDEQLWLVDGFLPHGLAGSRRDEDQPILLCGEDLTPRHDCLICIGGAALTKDEIDAADRACILFRDDAADQMAIARSQWSTLTAAGAVAKYYSQAAGRWELKAEKSG